MSNPFADNPNVGGALGQPGFDPNPEIVYECPDGHEWSHWSGFCSHCKQRLVQTTEEVAT